MRQESIIKEIILLVFVVFILAPFIVGISTSLKSDLEIYKGFNLLPRRVTFENYYAIFKDKVFFRYFINSGIYALLTNIGCLLIASLCGYVIGRYNFPFKNVIYLAFLAVLMIPIPASFVSLYNLMLQLKLLNTRIGYILLLISGNLPFSIFLLTNFFKQIPKELEEAAKIDGCNIFSFYYYILLPLSKPILTTLSTFVILGVWNEFLLASIVFSNDNLMPIQAGLMKFQGQYITHYEKIMAGSIISILPIIILYAITYKRIIKDIMRGMGK